MNSKSIKAAAVIAALIALCAVFPAQTAYLVRMLTVGWIVAFALEPLCDKLSKKLSRGLSAWLSLGIVVSILALCAVMLLPTIVIQTREVINMLPSIFESLNALMQKANEALQKIGLDPISAGNLDIPGITLGALEGFAASAGGVFQGVTAIFLGSILGVFILIDIDQARFRAEMLVPMKWRPLAIRMSRDVSMGLKMYVKGQLTVSLIVGAISAAALWLTGVKSPAALGAIVGVFNIIPYFGPIFGGVPAVLIALSQSLITALFTVAALFIVQQIDSVVISPRVMSGATGLKPSSTIIAMSIGGAGWGPIGMLLALPFAIIVKIALRTWASRND